MAFENQLAMAVRLAEGFLVEKAVARGRYVDVTTYRDGASEIKSQLLFRTPEEAAECARVLMQAKKPDR